MAQKYNKYLTTTKKCSFFSTTSQQPPSGSSERFRAHCCKNVDCWQKNRAKRLGSAFFSLTLQPLKPIFNKQYGRLSGGNY
jgi:hypothetical protein